MATLRHKCQKAPTQGLSSNKILNECPHKKTQYFTCYHPLVVKTLKIYSAFISNFPGCDQGMSERLLILSDVVCEDHLRSQEKQWASKVTGTAVLCTATLRDGCQKSRHSSVTSAITTMAAFGGCWGCFGTKKLTTVYLLSTIMFTMTQNPIAVGYFVIW